MTGDAFEREARKQGRVMRRRHWAFGLPLLGAMAVFLVVLTGIPLKARLWFATMYLVVLVIAITGWWRFLRDRYSQFPRVRCPTCGSTAQIEMTGPPHAHYYLVCSHCNQRADTGFGSLWSPYAPEA